MCYQLFIKNGINKLCFCTDNYFHNYHHLRNFGAYFPVHSFSACYIRMSCSGSRKYFVLYYYNYYNPVLNKRSKKADKKSRCEEGLFLLLKCRLFLYHHYCFFDHYLYQHHSHQKNHQNVFHLIIIILIRNI